MPSTNRRTFIKQMGGIGAGAAAALAFPNILLPKSKRAIGVALVGLGGYSTGVLAPALQVTEHCKLTGIVTGSPHKIPDWQEKYGIPDANVYNYENMHTVADNPDIDVIYIVLPHSMHMEYSIIAANAGKHVWCEKPMALTVDECQKIIDACNANRVKLTIGYRLQHEPNTQTVIAFGRNQTYGAIQTLTCDAGFHNRSGADAWRLQKAMGGGAMYDMGVYPLNAVRHVTGEEPVSVSARQESRRPRFSEVDEMMWFDLTFPSGAVANCFTTFAENVNKLHVDCTDGWFRLEPFQWYSGIKGETSDGKVLNETIPNQQARQMDNDALAILNDTDVIVPGEDGLKDIRVVEAVFESARTGREVSI
jgi:glucose-fructose oxidoreductase